jgi:hypothetical protein
MSHRFSSYPGVSARQAYVDDGSDYGADYDAEAARHYGNDDPAYATPDYNNAAYDARYAEPAAPRYAVVDALNDHCEVGPRLHARSRRPADSPRPGGVLDRRRHPGDHGRLVGSHGDLFRLP